MSWCSLFPDYDYDYYGYGDYRGGYAEDFYDYYAYDDYDYGYGGGYGGPRGGRGGQRGGPPHPPPVGDSLFQFSDTIPTTAEKPSKKKTNRGRTLPEWGGTGHLASTWAPY